jgi:hypothetical protein
LAIALTNLPHKTLTILKPQLGGGHGQEMGHKAKGRNNSLQETFFSVHAIILLMFLWTENTYELSVRRVKTVVKSYVQLIQATFYISIFIIQEQEFHIFQTCKDSTQILIWGNVYHLG